MNSRQLQYAVMLAEMRSFSQVAERVSLSQPALSKQIISLETELGVKLFERTTPLTLTPAGEFFVQRAEKLLFEEDQLLRTMERYKTGENGRLVIGVSPFRSLYLMPPVVRAIRERFPGVQVVLSEGNSAQLHKGITEGLFDFAIMNLPVDQSRLEAEPLEQDTLVLAAPKAMLGLIGRTAEDTDRPLDLAGCGALPFVTLSPEQELRRLFDKLCTLAGLQPKIDVEVVGIATAWAMVQSGVAASLLPRQFIQHQRCGDVCLFPLSQTTYTRQPAIITRRGQYLSPYAAYAIQLLREQ